MPFQRVGIKFVVCDNAQIVGISTSIGLSFSGMGAIFPAHSPSVSISGECPSALSAKNLTFEEIVCAPDGMDGSIDSIKRRNFSLFESTMDRSR